MKKNMSTGLAFMALLTSCEFEHPEPVIFPDPGFAQSGLQQVNANAIYEDYTIEVTISRTSGVSKELALNLSVDVSLVDEYNELYGTAYTLLGESYYMLPETVTIPSIAKEVSIPVVIHPHALVSAVGLEKANQTVLPIRIAGSSIPTEENSSSESLLLQPVVSVPEVSVVMPMSMPALSFIPGVPIVQNLTLKANTNFTTLDVTRIAYKPVMEKVAEYNQTHNTNYRPLPEETYTIQEDVFDRETMEMTSTINFDCSKIEDIGTYLLPLKLTQEGTTYNITEAGPIYVIIRLTDLRIHMANEGLLTTVTGKGSVKVDLNSPMAEDQRVQLVYDAEKVDEYNKKNGTNYKTFEASKVHVTETVISAGNTSCYVEYEIDILDLPYDDADKYLIPLSIDPETLTPGTIIEEPSTVYVEVNKSLAGNYFMELWPSALRGTDEKSDDMNSIIYLCSEQGKSPNGGQKYYFNYNKSWPDGVVYFDISDDPMPGHENCVRLINFQDRDPAADPIPANESYLNLTTGEVVIDFIIQSFFAPEPTEDGQIKGELRCVRLYRE